MIKEKTYYDIVCDSCGRSLFNINSAELVTLQSEWRFEIDGSHYCPDCYEVDEETDEYVPKPKEGGGK